MLDQILNSVREHASDLIVKNTAVPDQHNESVIRDATQLTISGLKNAATNGNLNDLLGMFTGSGSSIGNLAQNPIVGNIVSGLVGKLSQYGVSASSAQSLASSLIPKVLSHFSSKVNDPNDKSVDINGLMGSLLGSKGSGIDFSSVLNNINSGNTVDLTSLTSQFLGGDQKSKGGLLSGLGKLFGN